MKKLISIGVALAMLTMVVAPAAVGAAEEEYAWSPPEAQPPAGNVTATLPGSIVWTYLGVQDIVGQATGDATQHIASVLGSWSDDLAGPFFDALDGVLTGIGGLLVAVGDMLDMADIFAPLGDIFDAIADMFTALLTA